MKALLPRSFSFFLITAIVVIGAHLAKEATWGEAVDGLITALVFSLPFALGLRWSWERPGTGPGTKLQEWGLGALTALLMWGLIWLAWTLMPTALRSQAEPWAFLTHLAICLGTGLLSGILANKELSPF